MKLIAGVDVGNSTTEVAIGELKEDKTLRFLGSSQVITTGTKGTEENAVGIILGMKKALEASARSLEQLDVILLNEAAPVIGDTAMETITETIITESAMIGHNPDTPGGVGLGVGEIAFIHQIHRLDPDQAYIIAIPEAVSYEQAAHTINEAAEKIRITGMILQADEGVLVYNRLQKKIPIIDEVQHIEKVKAGCLGAVEVAVSGQTVQTLANPYGIASIFDFDAAQTKSVIPIAKSLIGSRSAVVIKTPAGEVRERVIPAGTIYIREKDQTRQISVDGGAERIMDTVAQVAEIRDIWGESGTNIGTMFTKIKTEMAARTGQKAEDIVIQDVLAVDTYTGVRVKGAIAGETYMEKAVGIAAMVKTSKLPMMQIAKKLQEETGVYTRIGGVEAVMAVVGAATTPGTDLPLAILDLGGGSTDGALLDPDGTVRWVHLAGAGELVTLLIQTELGLTDRSVAEDIKRYPTAKVESLFHIRLETGEIRFFDTPLHPKFFGKVVVLHPEQMIPIGTRQSQEKIIRTRQEAKQKVFIRNAIRALRAIAPMEEIRDIPSIVLVGGSALDFEIPEMLLKELAAYKIVCGRGNIRRTEGPRNAVATGLVMAYAGGFHD